MGTALVWEKGRQLKQFGTKRNLAYKRDKMRVKAEFKALGQKIKLEFEITKEITDFLIKYLCA